MIEPMPNEMKGKIMNKEEFDYIKNLIEQDIVRVLMNDIVYEALTVEEKANIIFLAKNILNELDYKS